MSTISPLVNAGYKQTPNYYKTRRTQVVGIAIHCMAGNMKAEHALDWFGKESTQAGANYNIGSDGHISCSCDEERAPWCTSNQTADRNCISIEVANIKGAPNWEVSDLAYTALIELCTDICYRNNIPKLIWKADQNLAKTYQWDKQNLIAHRFYKNKDCPGNYLYTHFGDIAEKVNKKLEALRDPVKKAEQELEELMMSVTTQEQAMKILALARQPLQDNDAGSWSEKSRAWAIENGLVKGAGKITDPTTGKKVTNYMWQDILNREQLVEILYRFSVLMGMVKDE